MDIGSKAEKITAREVRTTNAPKNQSPAVARLNAFGDTAIQLAKNPIGVIALFIFLVYAIAGIVVSIGKSESIEALMGMSFITIFPFIVLLAFYRLVTNHHMKLYDPSQIAQHEKMVEAWTRVSVYSEAITPEIASENKRVIASLQKTGFPATGRERVKTALYIGEWTSRRMAADRAVFRAVRKRGLAGFREALAEPRQHDAILRVLDFVEELSESMNNNDVDVAIVYGAMGSSLRRAWERSREFILAHRADTGDLSFMTNLEKAYLSYIESVGDKVSALPTSAHELTVQN